MNSAKLGVPEGFLDSTTIRAAFVNSLDPVFSGH
jgi:hypothetical protein